jgi:hypothetical protein
MKKNIYHGVKGEKITSNSESYEVNRKRDFIESMLLYVSILVGIIITIIILL